MCGPKCSMVSTRGGDFNDIESMKDQSGGSKHYMNRCFNHEAQINANHLIDLGASGNRFTWRRNRFQVRLDRVYVNMAGRCAFPNAAVINLPFWHSDHCPDPTSNRWSNI